MGKSALNNLMKRVGGKPMGSYQYAGTNFLEPNQRVPVRSAQQIWAAQQTERVQAAKRKEKAERMLEEARKRQEEYDKPLPGFPQKIPFDLRVSLLCFIRRVFSDSVKSSVCAYELGILRDEKTWPGSYDNQQLEDARAILGKFRDIPAHDFSVAIRVFELKQISASGKINIIATLYVWCGQGGYIEESVKRRLKKNLLKNIPALRPILGDNFVVRIWREDRIFSELKKSGYKADTQEERVTHLEIF